MHHAISIQPIDPRTHDLSSEQPMAETLEKLYALQYKYAYQLYKNGEEDEVLASLLDLLAKPRLSHYRRGFADLLIVSICISQGVYESNPIDAESFAKHAANAFREELAGDIMENRERVVGLLEQAEEALGDIRRIKITRARYAEMEDLIRQAKEIVDENGEFWRAREGEDMKLMSDEADNSKKAPEAGESLK